MHTSSEPSEPSALKLGWPQHPQGVKRKFFALSNSQLELKAAFQIRAETSRSTDGIAIAWNDVDPTQNTLKDNIFFFRINPPPPSAENT